MLSEDESVASKAKVATVWRRDSRNDSMRGAESGRISSECPFYDSLTPDAFSSGNLVTWSETLLYTLLRRDGGRRTGR